MRFPRVIYKVNCSDVLDQIPQRRHTLLLLSLLQFTPFLSDELLYINNSRASFLSTAIYLYKLTSAMSCASQFAHTFHVCMKSASRDLNSLFLMQFTSKLFFSNC